MRPSIAGGMPRFRQSPVGTCLRRCGNRKALIFKRFALVAAMERHMLYSLPKLKLQKKLVTMLVAGMASMALPRFRSRTWKRPDMKSRFYICSCLLAIYPNKGFRLVVGAASTALQ